MIKRRKGFTLIELTIVVIIIGILAAIAAPMMSNMKNRAITSEAVAALGILRSAMRNYYSEHGAYPAAATTFLTSIPQPTLTALQIKHEDFVGKYFKKASGISGYYLGTTSPSAFETRCYVRILNFRFMNAADETLLLKSGFTTGYLQMDQDGNITQLNLVGTGY